MIFHFRNLLHQLHSYYFINSAAEDGRTNLCNRNEDESTDEIYTYYYCLKHEQVKQEEKKIYMDQPKSVMGEEISMCSLT